LGNELAKKEWNSNFLTRAEQASSAKPFVTAIFQNCKDTRTVFSAVKTQGHSVAYLSKVKARAKSREIVFCRPNCHPTSEKRNIKTRRKADKNA